MGKPAMVIEDRWAQYWTELIDLIRDKSDGSRIRLPEALLSSNGTYLVSWLLCKAIKNEHPSVTVICSSDPGGHHLAAGAALISCLGEPPSFNVINVREVSNPGSPWPDLDGMSSIDAGADVVLLTDGTGGDSECTTAVTVLECYGLTVRAIWSVLGNPIGKKENAGVKLRSLYSAYQVTQHIQSP